MIQSLKFMPLIRRRMLLLTLLPVLVLIARPPAGTGQEKVAEVTLKVDFGDGLVWQYSRIEYKPKMTVMDVMSQLKVRKIQPLAFEYSGRGQNAFLKSIGGVANEGGGRSARNWFFRVGEKLGERSFGISEVSPGDEIIWHFGKYMPEN